MGFLNRLAYNCSATSCSYHEKPNSSSLIALLKPLTVLVCTTAFPTGQIGSRLCYTISFSHPTPGLLPPQGCQPDRIPQNHEQKRTLDGHFSGQTSAVFAFCQRFLETAGSRYLQARFTVSQAKFWTAGRTSRRAWTKSVFLLHGFTAECPENIQQAGHPLLLARFSGLWSRSTKRFR